MLSNNKSPLSNEFKIAVEIYGFEEKGELIWRSKLIEKLEGVFSKDAISKSLDTLLEWGIIKTEYGGIDTGEAGNLLIICNEAKSIVRELYKKFGEI